MWSKGAGCGGGASGIRVGTETASCRQAASRSPARAAALPRASLRKAAAASTAKVFAGAVAEVPGGGVACARAAAVWPVRSGV